MLLRLPFLAKSFGSRLAPRRTRQVAKTKKRSPSSPNTNFLPALALTKRGYSTDSAVGKPGEDEVILFDKISKTMSEHKLSGAETSGMRREMIENMEAVVTKYSGKNKAKELLVYQHLKKVFTDTDRAANLKTTTPIRVAVTGASGQIGYSLVFRIASGQMFGIQPVVLQLIELPQMMKALEGVVMELKDCAFPLVRQIIATDDLAKGFEQTDWAILVGAKPRSKGMERGDLILANAEIFSVQGKALNTHAKNTAHVLVVGNPANTNAMIAQHNAPKIPVQNFSSLTRLDHNRGVAQLAEKTGSDVVDVTRFVIWGNHSATQYPDISHTQINGKWAKQLVSEDWVKKEFIPCVQQRGAAIIAARGQSSAASAASAIVDHVRDYVEGTHDWTSVGVASTGQYGITPGIFYSYPTIIADGVPAVVQDVPIDPFSASQMEITHKELLKERDTVARLLK